MQHKWKFLVKGGKDVDWGERATSPECLGKLKCVGLELEAVFCFHTKMKVMNSTRSWALLSSLKPEKYFRPHFTLCLSLFFHDFTSHHNSQHSNLLDAKYCDSINRLPYFLFWNFISSFLLDSCECLHRLHHATLDPLTLKMKKYSSLLLRLSFFGLININLKTLLHLCWLLFSWMCVRRMMLMFQARLVEDENYVVYFMCSHSTHSLCCSSFASPILQVHHNEEL